MHRVIQLLSAILAVLRDIREELNPKEPTALLMVARLPNGTILKGSKLATILTDVQSVNLSLVETVPDSTAGGKVTEVPVTGPVVWESSDPAVLTVTPSADTFSAVASAVGPNGAATVKATADGLIATLDVSVVDSEVASLTIHAGTPFLTADGPPVVPPPAPAPAAPARTAAPFRRGK
jgi:hypothetical protein